jgi:hypothetical protein
MKFSSKIIFLFIFLLIIPAFSIAQEASIRGFVYEEETGEPAFFANIYFKGTTFGSSADVNGYYVISKVPAGDYTLIITYLGFDTIQVPVTLTNNQVINQNYFLKKSSINLEVVTINADRAAARTETQTSVVKITPQNIKQIPSVGGTPDFAQYLQVVPGIVYTGDQGGQFYVRGGSPIQNKVMLDGMTIYNPFHTIGLFSVFETDLIRNADVYTGGFNAEYGGRISSIMDITYRDGNKKRFSGAVGLTTFGSKILLEGPIVKQKSPEKGSSSFVLSFKNSFLEQSSQVFYDYVNQEGLPFNYTDFYGKISLNGANGSKVSFFGFNFSDRVNGYQSIADYGWNSYGAGTNFVVIPGKSAVLIEGLFAYSQYKSNINSTALNERESLINGFTGSVNFSYFYGKNELEYGVEVEGYRTEYNFTNFIGTTIDQSENTTQLGIFVKYKWVTGKFIFEPGFRMMWYASLAELSPEPRLAIKYNATDKFRLKFAGGLYSQNLIAASSDRDVVNLFYGFLSGPNNLPETFNGRDVTSSLQKADHLILGVEYDFTNFITVNLEGYYKYFPQLTNINRYKIYPNNTAPAGTPDVETKDFIVEKGNAYGLDVSLKYNYKKWYVWCVYSLGYVTRQFEDSDGIMISYNPHFDRRNNVNVILSYVTGTKGQWEFSARYNYGSGFPFNQVQGFYEYLILPGGINTDYVTENGQLGIIYGELYNGRLPTYSRLDLDMMRNIYFSENTKMVVDFSIINVFDRQNVFYVDVVTGEVVYQLPIMPSLGITVYF